VTESPLEQLMQAMDTRDVDAMMGLMAPEARLMTVDGRHAEGTDAVRELLNEFFGELRSTSHRITAQWHEDDVWIAEVDASYELKDWLQLNALPRAFIVRTGPGGITDVRAYGAHERPLTDHRTGEEGMWIGSRWIPPL
jgi:hypothetical protein